MTFWVAGAVLGSAVIGSVASNRASGQQADATNNANALQQSQYDQTRADQAPWRAAGQASLDRLMGLLSSGPYSTAQFTPQDLQNDPGYKFQQEQGMRGINNMADAFGIGGAALKSAGKFNQGLAGTSYNQAFDRYQTERTNTLNPLFKMAGFGETANQQLGAAGQNYANNTGNNIIGVGNVQAANTMNQGNIYGNAINQLGAWYNRPPVYSASPGYPGGNMGADFVVPGA